MARKTCKVCGKPKRKPVKLQAGVYKHEFEEDPFCSRACAETFYGTAAEPSGTNTSTALRPMVEPKQRRRSQSAA